MCNLVMVIGLHLVCIKWLLLLLPWVGWSLLLLILLCPNQLVGYTALEAPERVTQFLCLPYMMGGSSFPGLVPSDDAVNSDSVMGIKLVILVWSLGIRLMSLLTPGLQSGLWPTPTFILGSLARCHH